MTEDEAKTKMCLGPQVVALAVLMAGPREVELTPRAGRCVASDCMAWRTKRNTVTPDGYCGLAGAPP